MIFQITFSYRKLRIYFKKAFPESYLLEMFSNLYKKWLPTPLP